MKHLLPFIISLFLFACNNRADSEAGDSTDTVEVDNRLMMWDAKLDDSTGRLEMLRDKPLTADSLSLSQVIGYLNENFPNVVLVANYISNDTLYVNIPDATFLTQQMGSTGPGIYMASAVYNLTELPGIRFVNFNFEEGDHAAPGVFSRENVVTD